MTQKSGITPIEEWVEQNNLPCTFLKKGVVLKLDGETYIVLTHKDGLAFDENFEPIIDQSEESLISQYECSKFLLFFAGLWWCSDIGGKTGDLKEFRYIGKAKSLFKSEFPYLGVHGGYDLCEGSRSYSDWCKKAKFLGNTAIGLCEKNTLAGTLAFQNACLAAEMPFILGETCTIVDKDKRFDVKLYVQNEQGWKNLLSVNAQINVHNVGGGYCKAKDLFELSEGLICVLGKDFPIDPLYIKNFKNNFDQVYLQFDPVEYSSNATDKGHLLRYQEYFANYRNLIQPVLICDSYYLEEEDWYIKPALNKIGKVGFTSHSKDEYFKSLDDIYLQLSSLIPKERVLQNVILKSIENAFEIQFACDYKIDTSGFKLPSYIRINEEIEEHEGNEEFFDYLIFKGLERIGKSDDQEYLDRVETELSIIRKGGFSDYFLILWDIVKWCENNDILVGVGRGSAGGSLISYLLNITKIDPIHYGLLFERFLNESRIKSSAPDIDVDVEGERRDDVKRYIEQRYGEENVTSIGNFSTFKIKASIAGVSRNFNVPPQLVNYHNAMVEDAECSYTEFFKIAAGKERLKGFVKKYPQVFGTIRLLFGQPKNRSVHASGLVVTPTGSGGIFTQIPVRKIKDVLVSEWEGEYIDSAGYLKEDILGLLQLDKFSAILKLIKKDTKDKVDIYSLPLDDEDVYDKFRLGMNEDVFQLGASGLKDYCFQLKPDNIEDLIATVALYRPGPIDANSHLDYVLIKRGERDVELDHESLEAITRNTRGLFIFQEQVMQICQQLGGFDLNMADDIRRAMGKKKMEVIEPYREKFLEGCAKNGIDKIIAITIWRKMEGFAGYGFNRSHAVAYAYTGYICQWLKVHYPLQFWSVSLHYAGDKIHNRLSELAYEKSIRLLPPDINKSSDLFEYDPKNQNIYWSLAEVKYAGGVAQAAIEKMVKENNGIYSFQEFLDYLPDYKGINKKNVTLMVACGVFDEMEDITKPSQRLKLLDTYGENIKEKDFIEAYCSNTFGVPISKDTPEYKWTYIQRKFCNFGFFEYSDLFSRSPFKKHQLVHAQNFFDKESIGVNKCIGGIITEIKERGSKNGKFAQVKLDCNYYELICIIWNERWTEWRQDFRELEGQMVFVTGDMKVDSFKKTNTLQTNNKSEYVVL